MKLIILDAGDSFQLDGYNKLLLKNPLNGKTILENYLDIFQISKENVEIVVGFNSIPLMSEYPTFKYIYNNKWQTTGNSYSLSLVLDETPCIITSSDFFIKKDAINQMQQYENCIWVRNTENKKSDSLKCKTENNILKNVYRGFSRENDKEIIGLFKITDINILKSLRKNLNLNPSLYVAENLPYEEFELNVLIDAENKIFEINNPQDYIKYISDEKCK